MELSMAAGGFIGIVAGLALCASVFLVVLNWSRMGSILYTSVAWLLLFGGVAGFGFGAGEWNNQVRPYTPCVNWEKPEEAKMQLERIREIEQNTKAKSHKYPFNCVVSLTLLSAAIGVSGFVLLIRKYS